MGGAHTPCALTRAERAFHLQSKMNITGLNLASVRAVVFDVGGTLLTPHPSVGAVYAEILSRHGIELEDAIIEQRFIAAFRQLRNRSRTVINESTERAFWREIVALSIAPECPENLREAVFDKLFIEFASARRWRPLPGAVEILAALSARDDRPLAILSNWDARLHRVLAELDWTRYFKEVFISSEIGAEKPDPRAFQLVERALNLPSEALLHIGDSFAQDYRAARAAGWQAVLVGSPPPEHHATTLSVPTLHELSNLLF